MWVVSVCEMNNKICIFSLNTINAFNLNIILTYIFSFRLILLHVANTSLQNKSKPNADLFLWNWNDKMDLHFIVKVSNILVKIISFSDKKLHVYLFVKFPWED